MSTIESSPSIGVCLQTAANVAAGTTVAGAVIPFRATENNVRKVIVEPLATGLVLIPASVTTAVGLVSGLARAVWGLGTQSCSTFVLTETPPPVGVDGEWRAPTVEEVKEPLVKRFVPPGR